MHDGYPKQNEMEVPLLDAIARRGGQIWFSRRGGEIEEELADLFGLSRDDRELTSLDVNAKGKRVWRNHIQYVRLKLVDKGEIDKSVRDLWKVTTAGYRRLGLSPPDPERN